MSQISCQIYQSKMTAPEYVEEARNCVLIVGGGRPIGDTYERMLWRAVEKTGLSYARVWSYFYRKVRRPLADEMDALRRARDREKELIKQRWSNMDLDNKWTTEVGQFERLAKNVDQSAVRRADAATMPVAAPPYQDSRRTDQVPGRLLDGKAHRVGAR